MGRCIDCRGEFNRAIAEDKLRCPKCAKAPKPPEVPEEWKRKLQQAQDRKRSKGK